jgi:hypothetical protein
LSFSISWAPEHFLWMVAGVNLYKKSAEPKNTGVIVACVNLVQYLWAPICNKNQLGPRTLCVDSRRGLIRNKNQMTLRTLR